MEPVSGRSACLRLVAGAVAGVAVVAVLRRLRATAVGHRHGGGESCRADDGGPRRHARQLRIELHVIPPVSASVGSFCDCPPAAGSNTGYPVKPSDMPDFANF